MSQLCATMTYSYVDNQLQIAVATTYSVNATLCSMIAVGFSHLGAVVTIVESSPISQVPYYRRIRIEVKRK